jgi:PAS domain S-box-containing protein
MTRIEHDEHLFRLLVQRVHDYAIFMIDPKGLVMSWNEGAQALKGYQAHEIIGQSFERFYHQEDLRNHKPAQLLAIAAAQGRAEDEGWRIRKDGTRFWADVIITAIRDETGNLIGFGKVTRDLTERRRMEEALRETAQALENRVAERTRELQEVNVALQEKNAELEKFADSVVGRELAMIGLEKQVRLLREQLKQFPDTEEQSRTSVSQTSPDLVHRVSKPK